MTRFASIVMVLCTATAVSSAQPGEPAPPDSPTAPVVDRSQFDGAFDAMVRGDFATASAGFHAVATSGDPSLRDRASELARLADALIARGAKLVTSSAPGATAPPAASVSEDDAPDGGRTSFIVTTSLASIYTGAVAIDLLHITDVRAGTAIVMASTAAGVVGSILGTRGHTMTGGMADAWGLGMFVGAGNALLLSSPLGLYSGSHTDQKVLSLTLGAAWGTATAGLLVADSIRPTRGQVNVVETFGLMGLGSTLLGLAITQPSVDAQVFTTVTAVGLDGGLGAGAAFAARLDWSNSRARLVQLGAGLGALAGGGTSLLLLANSGGNDSGRIAAAITLAGLWGGFGLATHLTRDMAPDYRFRGGPSTSVTLAPTALQHGGGLAVVGAF